MPRALAAPWLQKHTTPCHPPSSTPSCALGATASCLQHRRICLTPRAFPPLGLNSEICAVPALRSSLWSALVLGRRGREEQVLRDTPLRESRKGSPSPPGKVFDRCTLLLLAVMEAIGLGAESPVCLQEPTWWLGLFGVVALTGGPVQGAANVHS